MILKVDFFLHQMLYSRFLNYKSFQNMAAVSTTITHSHSFNYNFILTINPIVFTHITHCYYVTTKNLIRVDDYDDFKNFHNHFEDVNNIISFSFSFHSLNSFILIAHYNYFNYCDVNYFDASLYDFSQKLCLKHLNVIDLNFN